MTGYIASATSIFKMYKMLGEKAIAQVSDEGLYWQANAESNSIAVMVKHLRGNMLSRWTDLLTTDGEKPWRQRDSEFEVDNLDRDALLAQWEEGWRCVFDTLKTLTDADLDRTVYIRNEGLTVADAISRQIAHYSYHVGQIVYVSKQLATEHWQSLSIPRNESERYNAAKFGKNKAVRDFTQDWTKEKS